MGTTPTDVIDPEVQEQREATLAAVGAPKAVTEDHIRADYFGQGETWTVPLPDGVSSFTHQRLMEGAKRKYMNAVNRDLVMNRQTQDARLKMAPGDDRAELLKLAIVGWDLVKDGQPLPFNERNLRIVLDSFPPEVLDIVEKDIRKHNAWLEAESTIEDIEREIENLQELLARKVKEKEGNVGSSS